MGGLQVAPLGPSGDVRWTYDHARNAIEVQWLLFDGTEESLASYFACG